MGTLHPPTTPPDHDQIIDRVAAFALDALDAGEVDPVERHLAVCATCRADLRMHHEVLALVGATASDVGDSPLPAAPPAVWRSIQVRLHDEPRQGATVLPLPPPRPSPERRRPPTIRRSVALLAATILLLTGVFGGVLVARTLAPVPGLEQAAARALADPMTRRGSLTAADGHVRATVAVTSVGDGYLMPVDLPASGPDRSYQLWGLRDAGPVSLGVTGSSPDMMAFHTTAELTTLAITEEPAGGSPAPTTPVLASTTLT